VCRRWAVGPICQGGVASYYSHASIHCTANQSDRAVFKNISKLACVDNEVLPRSIDRRISTAYGSVRASWVLAPIVALRGLQSSFPGKWCNLVVDTEDRNHIWAQTNPGGLGAKCSKRCALQSPSHSIWSTLFCAPYARFAGQPARAHGHRMRLPAIDCWRRDRDRARACGVAFPPTTATAMHGMRLRLEACMLHCCVQRGGLDTTGSICRKWVNW
jgi:hypothetical protein